MAGCAAQALLAACEDGNLELVRAFLGDGDVNQTTHDGCSPKACQNGHTNIAIFLLSKGANVNLALNTTSTLRESC